MYYLYENPTVEIRNYFVMSKCNYIPGVEMFSYLWVEIDKNKVEVVGQPAHREEDDNQGEHSDYLKQNIFIIK